jgi:hypothetical protein
LEINECEPESETLRFEEESEESDETKTGESSQGESSSPAKRPKRIITYEDKKKAVEFWKSGKTKKKYLLLFQTDFNITSIQQLYEFEKKIDQSGSRIDKLKEIWSFTFQKCKRYEFNCS